MDVDKLHFFDKDGYNLNFELSKYGYWEGYIYLPKVSVGLYANTSIYILEETSDGYCFPVKNNTGDEILFTWDRQNKFVDEFFMFDFDDSYIIQDTSSLKYIPNDGPECETLIINRFDEYSIPLENENTSKALPVHIAFMADEIYDATTYTRTLFMYYNGETIAKIKFFAETVEEDERLKIWNSNLGYNITPEDEKIFYKSDIKEYKPDYQLLNEKRKELMMEGSNIYPYIGSYKAIINDIKFFGYENLGIIEYWKNVNSSDKNFGKIYHSSRYSLTNKETLNVSSERITLPNKNYKKINRIALVYSINQPTGEVDEWELPYMKEKFTYTIEEALIKLFALRKKLNKEFMPGSSKIFDIIGEGNYFGLAGVRMINSTVQMYVDDVKEDDVDFTVKPSKYIHITDDRYFSRYINEKTDSNYLNNFTVYDISDSTVEELSGSSLNDTAYNLDNIELCQYYEDYYNDLYVNHTWFEDFRYEHTDDENAPISAKVIVSCNLSNDEDFESSQAYFEKNRYTLKKYDYVYGNSDIDPEDSDYEYNNYINGKIINPDDLYHCYVKEEIDCPLTFEDTGSVKYQTISWTVTMSDNQVDEDLKNIGVYKVYAKKDYTSTSTDISFEDYKNLYLELPYVGYYDVTVTVNGKSKTRTKCIKVEPYELEINGFYFDTRKENDLAEDENMYEYVQEKVENLMGWATSEKTAETITDLTMPTYEAVSGDIMISGPYINSNIDTDWCSLDNINAIISSLNYNDSTSDEFMKYVRYIKNGVDVKPYTWFLLTYNYSNISGKTNPKWKLINNTTDEVIIYEGRYLTCLLKKEGNYTVELTIEDNLDSSPNTYKTSRNIFVVDKDANFNIYQSFKPEYESLMEQEQFIQTKIFESYGLDDPSEE